jgi:hypothetical protein
MIEIQTFVFSAGIVEKGKIGDNRPVRAILFGKTKTDFQNPGPVRNPMGAKGIQAILGKDFSDKLFFVHSDTPGRSLEQRRFHLYSKKLFCPAS